MAAILSSNGEPQYAILPVEVTRKQQGSFLILLEISLLILPSKNSGYPTYLCANCFTAGSSWLLTKQSCHSEKRSRFSISTFQNCNILSSSLSESRSK